LLGRLAGYPNSHEAKRAARARWRSAVNGERIRLPKNLERRIKAGKAPRMVLLP